MQSIPETPELDTTIDFTGHLWIQELPTGGWLRFQLAESGVLRFGTHHRTVGTVSDVPAPYRRAARVVRDRFDRGALSTASADPAAITFVGIASWYAGIEYNWEEVPPFLGVDIRSASEDRYLPPDAATAAFERLGLPTLPAIEKERPVAYTDLTRYADAGGLPPSEWHDGPVAGILIRDKTGTRAQAWSHHSEEAGPGGASIPAEAVLDEYVTTARIERTIDRLRAEDEPRTVETVRDRIIADVAREHYADLYHDGAPRTDMATVESAVAERVQHYLADGPGE